MKAKFNFFVCAAIVATHWGVSANAQSGPGGSGVSGAHPSVGRFSYSFPAALNIDIAHETVTLPLYRGATRDGRTTWYIVTESSDQADAARRGVNYSNKMLNALGTAAVQNARFDGDDTLVFDGTVDFGLTRVLVPGPNGFPPAQFAPGAARLPFLGSLLRL